jgi:hypothetical protein
MGGLSAVDGHWFYVLRCKPGTTSLLAVLFVSTVLKSSEDEGASKLGAYEVRVGASKVWS